MNEITNTEIVKFKGDEIEVSAKSPDEMQKANCALIEWCKHKISLLIVDAKELKQSYEAALKHKWKSSTLKRHWQIATKRIEFYGKMKKALELGFIIVPNFPVTVFAIRTDRKNPLKLMTTYRHGQHEQKAETLPEGEGDYKNPDPTVHQMDVTQPGAEKKVFQYFAKAWKELDFPITMATPQIMEAANRTMALKLFDDLGVLPSPYRRADPMIIARIKDPRSIGYNQRFISFIIYWHLDTTTI